MSGVGGVVVVVVAAGVTGAFLEIGVGERGVTTGGTRRLAARRTASRKRRQICVRRRSC